MSEQVLYPVSQALAVYKNLTNFLGDSVDRIELAGSARRGKAWVHDLDVVVHAVYRRVGQMGLFDDDLASYQPVHLIQALYGIVDVKPEARKIALVFHGMPVELYLAEQDGSNFDALLQMRTGSKEFNITLAQRARQMGIEYRAGHGLFQMGRRVDDGTERGIFAALHLPYLQPERRN